MEEYKTRMIEEYGDLIKKYYKLKAFLEVEKGQRHLEAMDRFPKYIMLRLHSMHKQSSVAHQSNRVFLYTDVL